VRDNEKGDQIAGLAFNPDGRILACSSGPEKERGSVHLWDLRDLRNMRLRRKLLPRQTAPLSPVALSRDGHTLACVDHRYTVRLWDTRTGRSRGQLQGHLGAVTALVFAPEKRLLSGGKDGRLWVWNLSPEREGEGDLIPMALGEITTLAIHPTEPSVAVGVRSVLTGSGEGGPDLQVWDLLPQRSRAPPSRPRRRQPRRGLLGGRPILDHRRGRPHPQVVGPPGPPRARGNERLSGDTGLDRHVG